MIDFVLANLVRVFQLRRELPLAIHYSYIPPLPSRLPNEYTFNAGVEPYLWESRLGIENMSDKVLKDIRIKVPTKLLYDPIVEVDLGMTLHSWEFDHKMSEVKITAIDPREAVYVELFPVPEKCLTFTKPRVIVDGQLVNNSIQRYGFMKKYPWDAICMGGIGILLLVGVASIGYVMYLHYLRTIDESIIRSCTARVRVMNRVFSK